MTRTLLFWSTKLVQYYIEQEYDISYDSRQVRNILHSMGMTCQKPRPQHVKANKKAQEEFKKEFSERVKPFIEDRFKVFFLDESIFPVKPS